MADLFETNSTIVEVDPNTNYFEVLVGENKKYKDAAAAGKALIDKDNFIEQLKQETAQLRSELKNRVTMETFLDNLNRTKVTVPASETNPVTNPDQIQQPETKELKPEFSLEDVEKLMNEREARKIADNNLAEVTKKLKEAFGANYSVVLEQKASEFNLSKDAMNNLARQNPAAFLHLIGANTQKGTPNSSVPNSTARPNLPNTGTVKKNHAYYAQLKREKPDVYWRTQTQVEEHNAAMADPEGFFAD